MILCVGQWSTGGARSPWLRSWAVAGPMLIPGEAAGSGIPARCRDPSRGSLGSERVTGSLWVSHSSPFYFGSSHSEFRFSSGPYLDAHTRETSEVSRTLNTKVVPQRQGARLPGLVMHLSDKKSENVKLQTAGALQLPESTAPRPARRNKRLPERSPGWKLYVSLPVEGELAGELGFRISPPGRWGGQERCPGGRSGCLRPWHPCRASLRRPDPWRHLCQATRGCVFLGSCLLGRVAGPCCCDTSC